jgi:hypothetical protein
LSQSYEILLHITFTTQTRPITNKSPKIVKDLYTALAQIQADPTPGGMRDIVNPRLRDVIHKKHAGGREGHR